MKNSVYLIAVLGIYCISFMYQVLVYQSLIPILTWSNSTLYLDVMASHQGWKACKRFRWCEKSHPAAQWEVVWKGEASGRV